MRDSATGPPACTGCEPGAEQGRGALRGASICPPRLRASPAAASAAPHDQRCPGPGSAGGELEVCFACQGGGGGDGSHLCVRMGRTRGHRPPPEEASFSLLCHPRLQGFINNQHGGENTATKMGYYATPATAAGPLALPSARPTRSRHCPLPPRAAARAGPGNPVRAGGRGRQREEGVGRCDALNGAISFRALEKKVVPCST